MLPITFNEASEPPTNGSNQAPMNPPILSRGLKRMEGTSTLHPIVNRSPVKKQLTPSIFSNRSASVTNLKFSSNLSSSTGQATIFGSNNDQKNLFLDKPYTNIGLTRVETSTLKFNNLPNEKKGNPVKIHQENPRITPIRFKVERTPGGTISKATVVPKIPTAEMNKPVDEPLVTPPHPLRRTSSGSMLLRQTPERVRRQEGEETSPIKKLKNLAHLTSINPDNVTPVLRRKRTSSLTSLSTSDMPVLTPQRLRPRGVSETREIEEKPNHVRRLIVPTVKKRSRPESESGPSSPLKKRNVSSYLARAVREVETNPMPVTPLRKIKSTILNPKAMTERITQTYGAGVTRPTISEKSSITMVNHILPQLVARSTSGETYYTATEGDISMPLSESLDECEVPPAPENTHSNSEEMVPLVKKQMSIDEKILEDEEDEGFGDSMKTIRRGQGAHLARSVSLKLSSPRSEHQKSIETITEKSCSTPSLPTAPLVRQSSTLSLRFKVSPSTFLKPISTPPVESLPSSVVEIVQNDIVEPSTSKVVDESKTERPARKSSLKTTQDVFKVREDSIHVFRRRKIRFSGLNVHYFDRRQGESTVPTEGEVSLDMHNTHHSHRYFSLSSGKRPLLDLSLYQDPELSDEEVIDPDSDEDREYDEYASAKTILRINQRHRIKLLKKSGVKVEKNEVSVDSLRTMRTVCGCSCENGVCLPETCECAIEEINCQVDGGEYPTHPCACFAETCTNPKGRIFYDPDAVHQFRHRTIMNWQAAQKTGISGSPVIKKFVDSDDEDDVRKSKNWLLQKAIPIKLEESPARYPVTPVYTRRSRSNLSDIRESSGEMCSSLGTSTSLSERMKAFQNLDNDVCCEEVDEKEYEFNKEDTLIESNSTLQEVFVENDDVKVESDVDTLESAMSPVKTTLVV
uniref:CSRNP_N domain-containing protein n=1 Tax=Caenorhabditis tropicalis TaxID=1561998 RepID=A0A1I7ULC2_9PELO